MSEVIDFTLLELPIPDYVKTYSLEVKRDIYEYLSGLDDLHRKAYKIAYDHLGTSFDILRSNGFKEWIHNKSSSSN